MGRRTENSVRIIGGRWRSRRIRFPAFADLRPTPDRVRETLFNWLGQDLSGRICLDLFAGSGAIGFEALSRGARSVTLVERDSSVCAALLENARRLGADAATIECTNALEFVARATGRYDVVFLDPPFRYGVPPELWSRLPALLEHGGLIYLESGAPGITPDPELFSVIRSARAGNVHFQLVEKRRIDANPGTES